jgi:hypothetical protein
MKLFYWITCRIYSKQNAIKTSSLSVIIFSHLNVHVKLGSSGRWRTGKVIEMLDDFAWCAHCCLVTDLRRLSKLVVMIWCHVKRHAGLEILQTYFFCTSFTEPFFFNVLLKVLVKLWARLLLSGTFRAQLQTPMFGALTEVFGFLYSISRHSAVKWVAMVSHAAQYRQFMSYGFI